MSANVENNTRPEPDNVLVDIANYVCDTEIISEEAYQTAKYCLMDSIGCAILALNHAECKKLLGPVVDGTSVPFGGRVIGTQFILDPIKAAWDLGTMIRWLDFNDTWLAAEWGHPSDNLGAILAVADYVSQQNIAAGKSPLLIKDILTYMIKAHEIQGIIALENSFNRVGLDHVLLVKIASTAVITHMLGGNKSQIIDALSQAWIDGQSLRTYRHAPNTGSRKSWAAGDATARAVQLAMITIKGEMGYPSALTAPKWGFNDVLFKGQSLSLSREYGSYVMENILFKIAYPAEFHAQTAIECALTLYPSVHNHLDDIERIVITTHESAIRIISKQGELSNCADRDHCLQYMVAIALIFGRLTADDYQDDIASDPRIDKLRKLMVVEENATYSEEYLQADKRTIANGIQIFFTDNTKSPYVECHYPIGHRRRRKDGLPLLAQKFAQNLATQFSNAQCQSIIDLFNDSPQLDNTPVTDFISLFVS